MIKFKLSSSPSVCWNPKTLGANNHNVLKCCSSTKLQTYTTINLFTNSFHKKVPVILLNDIDKLGIAGQEKAVSRGHFRNVLAPQKLAVVATPSNRAKIPVAEKERLESIERQKRLAKASERLSKIVVRFKRHVLPNGSLHAGVSKDNVVEKLKVQHAIDLNPTQVMLATPIKSLGDHTIQIMIDNSSFPLKLKIDQR